MAEVNLYVGNLDDDIDEEYLRGEFECFGTVISAVVMKGTFGKSLGYGFVCFDSLQSAEKAIREMNGTVMISKNISVSVAQNQHRRYMRKPSRDHYRSQASIRSNSPDSSRHSYEQKMPFENKNPDPKVKWRSRCTVESDSASYVSSSSARSEESNDECPQVPNVAQRIRSLYEDQLFTDVKFIIYNDGKAKTLMAHKAILAVGSVMFRQTLYGDKDGYRDDGVSEISINDITFDTFKNIVEYLYTDEVFFEDNILAVDLLRGAKQYQVQSLVDRCESYFESIEISQTNACSMLQVSISNNIESLKSRCFSFIRENTKEVIRSVDFKNSPINTIRTICKLPQLNLRSEVELFEAIMLWADSCRKDGANKRAYIDPLLKCIRFLTMKTEEFSSLMRKYPSLLTNEEIVSIITSSEATTISSKSLSNSRENRCIFMRRGTSPKSVNACVVIPLKPSNLPQRLKNLKCVLEINCLEGFHELKSVKLLFQEPVEKGSRIVLDMTVVSVKSGYIVHEPLDIHDSSSVTVPLSQSIYVRRGDRVRIEADARKIERYKFYQFGEEFMPDNSCFTCNVGSSPSQNRLFFISEVNFVPRLRAKNFTKPRF